MGPQWAWYALVFAAAYRMTGSDTTAWARCVRAASHALARMAVQCVPPHQPPPRTREVWLPPGGPAALGRPRGSHCRHSTKGRAAVTDPSDQEHPLIEPAELPGDFDDFFRRHYKEFLKSVASRMRNLHDAEEVVLEAGLRMYRKWPRIQAHPNPIALAHRILNGEVAGFFRRQARVAGRETSYGELSYADVPTVDDLLFLRQHDDLDRALAELEHLAPKRAACVRLRYLSELSYEEVAERLEISYGTAKVHVSQGLRHLQTLMDLSTRGKGDS